jgi:hypothetical protein
MFGSRLVSKSADGFLGNPAPEPQPDHSGEDGLLAHANAIRQAQATAANDALRWRVDAWRQLSESARLLIALSLATQKSAPQASASFRTLAAAVVKGGGVPCPVGVEWWSGLPGI